MGHPRITTPAGCENKLTPNRAASNLRQPEKSSRNFSEPEPTSQKSSTSKQALLRHDQQNSQHSDPSHISSNSGNSEKNERNQKRRKEGFDVNIEDMQTNISLHHIQRKKSDLVSIFYEVILDYPNAFRSAISPSARPQSFISNHTSVIYNYACF